MKPNDASPFGSECSDGLAPTVWARKDQIQQAITRGGLMCSMYPDTNQRTDLQPLYDQAALDAAVAETNRRQNEAWRLMCEKMVAAERERCSARAIEAINANVSGDVARLIELVRIAVLTEGPN